MADKSFTVIDASTGERVHVRLHDNGDGTYSPALFGSLGSAVVDTIADGADVAQGAIADAVVAAGAAGTLSAKLRAISRDLVGNIVLAAGSNKIGGVTIADGDAATVGALADAVVAAGAAGSLSAKLRRLTTDLSALLALLPAKAAVNSAPANTLSTLTLGAVMLGDDGANLQPIALSTAAADASANSLNRLRASVVPHLYNGASWDRQRGNVEGTAVAAGTYTSIQTSADLTNHNARGVIYFLNVTAASGTGGIQPKIQFKDPVSGSYLNAVPTPTAVIATGLTLYSFYPGVTAPAGTPISQTNQNALPRTFRFQTVHVDGTSYTYSLGYCLVL